MIHAIEAGLYKHMDFIQSLPTEMMGRLRATHYRKLLNINSFEESVPESIKLEELLRGAFLILIIFYLITICLFILSYLKNLVLRNPNVH